MAQHLHPMSIPQLRRGWTVTGRSPPRHGHETDRPPQGALRRDSGIWRRPYRPGASRFGVRWHHPAIQDTHRGRAHIPRRGKYFRRRALHETV